MSKENENPTDEIEEEGEVEFEEEEAGHGSTIESGEDLHEARMLLRSPDGESKLLVHENAEVIEDKQDDSNKQVNEIVIENPDDKVDETNFRPPTRDPVQSAPIENDDDEKPVEDNTVEPIEEPPVQVVGQKKKKKRRRKKKVKSEKQQLEEKKALQHFLHEKMNRESEIENLNSHLNSHVLRRKWIKVLREEKVSKLKEEIEVLSEMHNRQVKRKDEVISVLWKDLNNSEKQFKRAVRMHKNHVNELMDLQKIKVDKFEVMSMKYLGTLQKEYECEFSEMENLHKDRVGELQHVTKEMIRRENNKEYELDKEFEIQKKAIRSKYKNHFHVMTINMKKLINSKKRTMEQESHDIGKPIQKKYSDYMAKRNENQVLSNKIKDQKSTIRRYEDQLSVWKAKLLNNLREFQRRDTSLNSEIKKLRRHFHVAKKKMTVQRDVEKKRLTELVKSCGKTAKVLDSRIAQSKILIEMANLNMKHETEFEREIDNFIEKSDNESSEVVDMNSYQHVGSEEREDGSTLDYIILMNAKKLGKFFTKFNKVSLENKAELEKQEMLMEDNRYLKAMLKKYLDGIAVNQEILSRDDNNLLMVRQFTRSNEGVSERIMNHQ